MKITKVEIERRGEASPVWDVQMVMTVQGAGSEQEALSLAANECFTLDCCVEIETQAAWPNEDY